MAVIIPTLGTIKGKLGGVCFQVNPAGNILRTKPNPRYNQTTKQREIIAEQNFFLQSWQMLSLETQLEWNTYANVYPRMNYFGQSKTVSGFNWFYSCNANLIAAGITAVLVPPTHYAAAAPPNYSVETDDAGIYVYIDPEYDYTNTAVCIWSTPPTTRSSNSLNRIRKRVLVITSTPAYPLNITAEWEAATGLAWSPLDTFPNAKIQLALSTIDKRAGTVSPYVFTVVPVLMPASIYYYYT